MQTHAFGRGAVHHGFRLARPCIGRRQRRHRTTSRGRGRATTPGAKAKLVDGVAVAPASAPRRVKRAIAAANRIIDKPYCYGGGHGQWESRCYDCSGTVSYALGKRGARVLDAPLPSGSFAGWEKGGRGRWITVYANGGHAYVVIAGLRLDTSMTPGNGPGWSKTQLHQERLRRASSPRALDTSPS